MKENTKIKVFVVFVAVVMVAKNTYGVGIYLKNRNYVDDYVARHRTIARNKFNKLIFPKKS